MLQIQLINRTETVVAEQPSKPNWASRFVAVVVVRHTAAKSFDHLHNIALVSPVIDLTSDPRPRNCNDQSENQNRPQAELIPAAFAFTK
jgi:hypothetical protein